MQVTGILEFITYQVNIFLNIVKCLYSVKIGFKIHIIKYLLLVKTDFKKYK